MSNRLSPEEIAFLSKYCSVMKLAVKALNILQSETSTHMGLLPGSFNYMQNWRGWKPHLRCVYHSEPQLIAAAILLPKFKNPIFGLHICQTIFYGGESQKGVMSPSSAFWEGVEGGALQIRFVLWNHLILRQLIRSGKTYLGNSVESQNLRIKSRKGFGLVWWWT